MAAILLPTASACGNCCPPSCPPYHHPTPHPPGRPRPHPRPVPPIVKPPPIIKPPGILPPIINPPGGGIFPPIINPPGGGILPPNPPYTPPGGGVTPPGPGGNTNATCPINALKLGLCLDVLGGLVHVGIGDPIENLCCPVIQGLLELEAAICLCTIIRIKLLNLNIFIPIALQILATCGLTPPPGFVCPPLV